MQEIDHITMVALIVTFIAVAFTLSMPGVFILSHLFSMGKRETTIWMRMETELKQERRERARLQLLVDRLLRQLREANVVPDLDTLYVTDEDLIFHQIDLHFNESELQDLCYRLGIDYENLQGLTKRDRTRSLTLYMERHDRTGELVALLICLRPTVAW
jgi:hypothetical protein